MKREVIRYPRPPIPEHTQGECEYQSPPSRLDIARFMLECLQFAADVYERWKSRQDSKDEAEMSPTEAREYAAEILAAADKAEANNRDGEDWPAP